MKTLGIIPARFSSSRLPGKPLADIHGKPMIWHVYQGTKEAVDRLIVATDDERIAAAVRDFGGEAMMTSPDHVNGSSRCAEVVSHLEETYDVIVNIQGDEPMIETAPILSLVALFSRPEVEMATLALRLPSDFGEMEGGNSVYLTVDKYQRALYFSRQVIPFMRDVPTDQWTREANYFRHIGMYAFRPQALVDFSAMEESPLEQIEKLEQLRWLENGRALHVAFTNHYGISVDTDSDLALARKKIPSTKTL
ncbi:MAG: 3-deoxy-manno-octulosonate cytidylyltransferase [Cryomorphaceae bacterium]|nr:3-deoxy-manno-octulosonate cytidylyltransferase [Cryomorphaceae bacterium]